MYRSSVYSRPISVARVGQCFLTQVGSHAHSCSQEHRTCCQKRWSRFKTEKCNDCCRNIKVISVIESLHLGMQHDCGMS